MRVLGVPVLNRPDLLARMLASIDIEFDRIVIIDNSTEGIVSGMDLPENALVIGARHNLGVAASWNLIVKLTPLAHWWCIVNSDVEFAPGDLSGLAGQVRAEPDAFSCLDALSVFALTPSVVERVGWFDEGLSIPAYYEDNDYRRRVSLAGVRWVVLPACYRHDVSSTIGSDQKLSAENGRTFPLNTANYLSKWGGPPGGERFNTPYDAGGDVRDWRLSIDRLRAQTWRIK